MKKNQVYEETAVDELKIFVENDGELYNKEIKPIYKNLAKKQQKGTYDSDKAQKSYYKIATDGAKKYDKEFGSQGGSMFTTADRREVAKRLEEENKEELKNYL